MPQIGGCFNETKDFLCQLCPTVVKMGRARYEPLQAFWSEQSGREVFSQISLSFLALPPSLSLSCRDRQTFAVIHSEVRVLDWGQSQSLLFVLRESIVNRHAARLKLFAELIVVWWCHSQWPEEKLTPVVRVFLKCHLHNYGWSVPGLL